MFTASRAEAAAAERAAFDCDRASHHLLMQVRFLG
jgi:hypothetical protein